MSPTTPTETQIRARAHALYLARGAKPGRDLDDWYEAERQLKAEAAGPPAPASVPAAAPKPKSAGGKKPRKK